MTRIHIFCKKNVALTICCVWWMCFGYREQQTIVIFAIVDDIFCAIGTEVLIFELVFFTGVEHVLELWLRHEHFSITKQ